MGEEQGCSKLFLQLLGDVRLLSGDHDLCPRGRKARGVLAYLAVAPTRSATRERLADLLWTDRGPEQARGSLRQTLAEVRRCAPDRSFLDIGRERVRVDPDAVTTDLEAVMAAAVDRSAPDLARIMGDVRGCFGDGLDGLAVGFDEWLAAERHQQHERIVACVLDAAGDMLGRSPSGEMQAILRGLDHLDPLNEAVARLGMRVDQAGDDRASLHRRYRRLEAGLAREFGSRPTEETRTLFAALTSLVPPPDAPRLTPGFPDAAPTASPPTILVTPLAVDARGEGAELAEVCTDDIRVALTRLPDLRVIMLDTADVERLDVVCAGAVAVYLLSGRLRRVGDEVRVNLQLGNVHSHTVVWSEQLRLPAGDLLDAVDQVVERAAGAVLPSIDRDLPVVLGKRAGEDAASLYVHARLRVREAKDAEAAEEGCALLERVLELDGRHLRALLLLARMYNTDHWQLIAGHDVAAFRARARALCERAATVEPSNVELGVMRAWCDLRRREWRLAQAGFERAVRALPHDPDTTNLCAFGFCHLGELEKADALMQRAFRLNPFPPTDYHADHAVVLALQGRAQDAEEHFEVSGEEGLQYLAVRIANCGRIAGRTDEATLRTRFKRAFKKAWRGGHPPRTTDLARWIDDTIPLRSDEHRRFLQEGLVGALH